MGHYRHHYPYALLNAIRSNLCAASGNRNQRKIKMAITIGDINSFNLPDDTEIIINSGESINLETIQAGIARKHKVSGLYFYDGEMDEKEMFGYESAKFILRTGE